MVARPLIALADADQLDRQVTLSNPQIHGEWVRLPGTNIWKNTRTGERRVVPSIYQGEAT